MQVLYGIVGEGMGHATRSRVLIEHLLKQRHRVRIAASGSAVIAYLRESLGAHEGFDIVPIRGLTLSYRDSRVLVRATLLRNLAGLPRCLLSNARALYQTLRDGFRPDVVVSDFETWSCFVGHVLGVPIIGIDNNYVLDRCELAAGAGRGLYFHLARLAVKLRQPQPEQQLNAYYLGALGLGAVADRSDADVIRRFLGELPRYEAALSQAPAWNNRSATSCLDELLQRIAS